MGVRRYLAVIVILFASGLALAQPKLFTRGTLQQALDWSRSDPDGLLVVDFKAEWCHWCVRMEQAAWVDPRVVTAVEDSGYAIQIDSEERSVIRQYGVVSYPTVVAFMGGKEVARQRGYMTAEALVAWLDRVKRTSGAVRSAGDVERAVTELAERWLELRAEEDRAKVAEDAVELWLDVGSELGAHAKAASLRRALVPVLADAYRSADKETVRRIDTLRDGTRGRGEVLDPGAERDRAYESWVLLSEATGAESEVLSWVDEAYRSPRRLKMDAGLRSELVNTLTKQRRWVEAGRFVGKPAEFAMREVGIAELATRGTREGEVEYETLRREAHASQAERLGRAHASLLAARQLRPAWTLYETVKKSGLKGEERDAVLGSLVSYAIDVGVAQPRHRSVLGACGTPDPTLERALADALR